MGWLEQLLLNIIDSGEVPEHIAIIMDGNRRYARKMMLGSVGEGHKEGANKLKQIIEWLSKLHGVKMLTVYAFSILNFNRSKSEVKQLMDLAAETFKEIADQPDILYKHNCRINFIGQIGLMDDYVLKQVRRLHDISPKNPEFILNICACYTSHDEIEHARDKCFEDGADPTYDEVFSRLQLPKKPDLLIRTSGVSRMSNFLLMQCSNTPIYITDQLWPELSFFTLFKILISYQLRNIMP